MFRVYRLRVEGLRFVGLGFRVYIGLGFNRFREYRLRA